jgi:hypothetical protein
VSIVTFSTPAERQAQDYSRMRFAKRIERLPYLRAGEWRFLAERRLLPILKGVKASKPLSRQSYEDLQDIIAGWQSAQGIAFLCLPDGMHLTGPARDWLRAALDGKA